jgi:tetratricopeptide (TPR) repeat protein
MNHAYFYILCCAIWIAFSVQANALQTAQNDSLLVAEGEEATAKATYIQALQAFENEQYNRALDLLESAYPKLNKYSGVNFALADIYFQLGEIPNATEYAMQAVRLDPANKWYRLKLADIYDTSGQNTNAIKQLEAAQRYHPKERDILSRLAIAYANEGSLEKAKNQYNTLIQLGAPAIALRMQKLKIFSLLEQHDSLAVEIDKIRELNPRDSETFELLSNYYEDLGENQQAQEMLKKAGLDEPNDINTLKMRAEIYVTSSQWDSLEALGISLMGDSKLAPEQKLEFTRSIYESFGSEESPKPPVKVVQLIIEKLLEKETHYIPAHKLAADFFAITNQSQKALKHLAEINSSEPGNKDAWLQRLQILLNEGDSVTALKIGEQADENVPQEPFIYYAIGSSYLSKNSPTKALQWLKRAVDLPARSNLKADIFEALGKAYFKMEQWQSAFEAYKNAIDYGQPTSQLLERMGDAMHKLNKPEEAKQWWQKALQEDPGNKRLQEKLSQ